MPLPRLRRRYFWGLSGLARVAFFAVREGMALERQRALATAWSALALLALGTLCALRLHDRGRNAWWLAASLVPVAGALWLAWELALRHGTPDANAYGPDPRQPDTDTHDASPEPGQRCDRPEPGPVWAVVGTLAAHLRDWRERGVQVEHLYDY